MDGTNRKGGARRGSGEEMPGWAYALGMVAAALVAAATVGGGKEEAPGGGARDADRFVERSVHGLGPEACRLALADLASAAAAAEGRFRWMWVEETVRGSRDAAHARIDRDVSPARPRPYAFAPGEAVPERACAFDRNSVHAVAAGWSGHPRPTPPRAGESRRAAVAAAGD